MIDKAQREIRGSKAQAQSVLKSHAQTEARARREWELNERARREQEQKRRAAARARDQGVIIRRVARQVVQARKQVQAERTRLLRRGVDANIEDRARRDRGRNAQMQRRLARTCAESKRRRALENASRRERARIRNDRLAKAEHERAARAEANAAKLAKRERELIETLESLRAVQDQASMQLSAAREAAAGPPPALTARTRAHAPPRAELGNAATEDRRSESLEDLVPLLRFCADDDINL